MNHLFARYLKACIVWVSVALITSSHAFAGVLWMYLIEPERDRLWATDPIWHEMLIRRGCFRAVPGLFWAIILAFGASLAYDFWAEGNKWEAARLCRKFGFWCAVLTGFLGLLPAIDLMTFNIIGVNPPVFDLAGQGTIANINLQASFLMLLIGYLGPRSQDKTVQVTENLHM